MVHDLNSQLTAGEIARQLDVPLHRVNHVLATRKVPPISRVGIIRVYAETTLEMVAQELAVIDARRARRACST